MFRFASPKSAHGREGMTRRDVLHAGALSLLGMGLSIPEFMAMQAQGAVRKDRDINCILLFLRGAPSQLDTWDMKPNASREFRSPFQPIKTNVPGIEISELFPRMAKHADMFSIARSVYHAAAVTHDTGQQMMQMERLFPGGLEYPNTSDFTMPAPVSPDYISVVREERRHTLRSAIDDATRAFENSANARRMNDNFHRAYTLLSSSKSREAFDISRETEEIRDKYGRNRFGQSCLLARRMVERGVRFVTINMFESVFHEVTWDIHGSAPFPSIDAYKTVCGPWFDNGYTSLIEELRERGLYDTTIVIATGEFGRTPRINRAGGRDHWPHCWSLILGGGGIKGGHIVGASDTIAAYPTDRPTTPADIAATLYIALGIDPTQNPPLPGGHSVPVVADSTRPLRELL